MLCKHATYDVSLLALDVLVCTVRGRRRPGESPMWIAQTIGIEGLVSLTLVVSEAHITLSLDWQQAAPDCPGQIMRVSWKSSPVASLRLSPRPPSVATKDS